MREHRYRVALLLAATVLPAAPAQAGEGRIPLYEPAAITMPGSYVVTRDIRATGGPILDVQIGGVSVDLNGHTLAVSNATDPVIQVSSVMDAEPEPFRVANGKLMGGMYGIHGLVTVSFPRKISLADLTIVDAAEAAVKVDHLGDLEARGIIIVGSHTAFDLAAPMPTPDGESPTARIRNSEMHADVGVSCNGVVCDISQTSVASCGTAVALVGAGQSEVAGNTLTLPGSTVCFNPQPEPPGDSIHVESSPGVRLTGNTIQGSPASTGANHAITADAASPDAFIADNLITGFGNDGMHLMSSDNVIRGNLINRNGGNGIFLGGIRSIVESNKISANGGSGIVFNNADNVYRGNILLGNASPASGIGLSDTIDGGGNI